MRSDLLQTGTFHCFRIYILSSQARKSHCPDNMDCCCQAASCRTHPRQGSSAFLPTKAAYTMHFSSDGFEAPEFSFCGFFLLLRSSSCNSALFRHGSARRYLHCDVLHKIPGRIMWTRHGLLCNWSARCPLDSASSALQMLSGSLRLLLRNAGHRS